MNLLGLLRNSKKEALVTGLEGRKEEVKGKTLRSHTGSSKYHGKTAS